jgi:hypothetical protein
MGEWADLLDPWPEGWLAQVLHQKLCAGPDLTLSGRDLAQGIMAPRVVLTHEVVVASEGHQRNSSACVYLDLRPNTGRAEIRYSFAELRPNLPSDVELHDVRIEGPPNAGPRADSPSHLAKPAYDAQAAEQWLNERPKNWHGATPSTGAQCLAAAREHFGSAVPRKDFLALRSKVLPKAWTKPGPRGPRR